MTSLVILQEIDLGLTRNLHERIRRGSRTQGENATDARAEAGYGQTRLRRKRNQLPGRTEVRLPPARHRRRQRPRLRPRPQRRRRHHRHRRRQTEIRHHTERRHIQKPTTIHRQIHALITRRTNKRTRSELHALDRVCRGCGGGHDRGIGRRGTAIRFECGSVGVGNERAARNPMDESTACEACVRGHLGPGTQLREHFRSDARQRG